MPSTNPTTLNTTSSTPTMSTLLSPTDTALLETFIPGYSMLSRLLKTYLQIDLSQHLPTLLLVAIFAAASRYIYQQVSSLFQQHCICTAEIRHDDDVYNYLMHWLAQQPFTNRTTQFVAGTRISGSSRYYDSDDEDSDGWGESDEIDEEGNVIVDFDTYWAKATARDKHKKLRFTPSEGTHYFWFHGRPLAFIREKEENKNGGGTYYGYGSKAPERLSISCVGRDPRVLKELLIEAQKSYVARDSHNTVIYRGQKSGGYTEWSRCMARTPRALSTVVLDKGQKDGFIGDIKEYLHPRTRRWYSNRGIPYRRGYLLHGPPGTGKTSLCFAAAGLLGLELYLLNLSSKSLDEDELMALFAELPRRCIVLLEDVDCAGMSQKRSAEDGKKEEAVEVTPPQEEGASGPSVLEKQGVSLSGLLNVIDGVAACEGRILVMTTNHPEKLDPALIRPGRVDLTIAFGYSSAADIRELFSAIYSTLEGDLRASTTEKLSRALKAKIQANAKKSAANDLGGKFPAEKVSLWAERFAENVPEGEFTPAEIQGYLLHHKTDPEGAIEGAKQWVVETRDKKARIAKGEVLIGKSSEKSEEKKTEGEKSADTEKSGEVNGGESAKTEQAKTDEPKVNGVDKVEDSKEEESKEAEKTTDSTTNGITNGTTNS
ncbi:BCS1 N terminal-domain-containing protein [Aspergillus karnatakaensis]|uniref:BCS1 and AAA domain-containing protein n=1 Tax=Aspergillus karnatakaensis TaxID=1810916 RepID=UPI003CCCA7B4